MQLNLDDTLEFFQKKSVKKSAEHRKYATPATMMISISFLPKTQKNS